MTPEPTTETCIKTYLRRATRGLWGKRRLEVREELAAHLEARVLSYQLAGYDEMGALGRALSEMGNPREVSLGMAKLYTFPTLLGSGAALAAACVCVVALLPKGVAQTLPVTQYWPSAKCIKQLDEGRDSSSSGNCISGLDDLWFNQQTLKQTLEPQGVIFGSVPAPESDTGLLSFRFPGSTPVYLSLRSLGSISLDLAFSPDFGKFLENGNSIEALPGYISLWKLFQAVSLQKDIKTEVSGWNSPVMKFGDISLKIGTKKNPITGHTFYDTYMNKVYSDDLAPNPAAESTYYITPRLSETYNQGFENVPLQRTVVEVPDADRNAYGIAMRLDPAKTLENTPSGSGLPNGEVWDEAVSLSVSRADAQGNVSFMVPKGPLHFVESFTEKLDPGAAVLVKLNSSGTNWYEVVAPERISVQ